MTIELNNYKSTILDVKKHLQYKCAKWIESDPIQYAIKHKNFNSNAFYITGGCFSGIFKSIISSPLDENSDYSKEINDVKDYDVFFTENESMEIMYDLYEYYDEWVASREMYNANKHDKKEEEKLITDNAITLCDPNKFQLICRYDRVAKEPIDNVKNFDFQHLIWYYHYGQNKLYISGDTVYCVDKEILDLNPTAKYFEVERYERFKKRGWKPTMKAESKYLTESEKRDSLAA